MRLARAKARPPQAAPIRRDKMRESEKKGLRPPILSRIYPVLRGAKPRRTRQEAGVAQG